MLFNIFTFMTKLRGRVNGNPEVSLHVSDSEYFLQVLWLEEGYRYRYIFSIINMIAEYEEALISIMTRNINREYNKMKKGAQDAKKKDT